MSSYSEFKKDVLFYIAGYAIASILVLLFKLILFGVFLSIVFIGLLISRIINGKNIRKEDSLLDFAATMTATIGICFIAYYTYTWIIKPLNDYTSTTTKAEIEYQQSDVYKQDYEQRRAAYMNKMYGEGNWYNP